MASNVIDINELAPILDYIRGFANDLSGENKRRRDGVAEAYDAIKSNPLGTPVQPPGPRDEVGSYEGGGGNNGPAVAAPVETQREYSGIVPQGAELNPEEGADPKKMIAGLPEGAGFQPNPFPKKSAKVDVSVQSGKMPAGEQPVGGELSSLLGDSAVPHDVQAAVGQKDSGTGAPSGSGFHIPPSVLAYIGEHLAYAGMPESQHAHEGSKMMLKAEEDDEAQKNIEHDNALGDKQLEFENKKLGESIADRDEQKKLDRAQHIVELKDRLTSAKEKADADRELRKALSDMGVQARMAFIDAYRDRTDVMAVLRQMGLGLQKQNLDLRGEALESSEANRINSKVGDAPNEMRNIAEAQALLGDAKNEVGLVAGGMPQWIRSDKGRQFVQKQAQLLAPVYHSLIGAAQTPTEKKTMDEAWGRVQFGTTLQEVEAGMNELRDQYQQKVKSTMAANPRGAKAMGSAGFDNEIDQNDVAATVVKDGVTWYKHKSTGEWERF